MRTETERVAGESAQAIDHCLRGMREILAIGGMRASHERELEGYVKILAGVSDDLMRQARKYDELLPVRDRERVALDNLGWGGPYPPDRESAQALIADLRRQQHIKAIEPVGDWI